MEEKSNEELNKLNREMEPALLTDKDRPRVNVEFVVRKHSEYLGSQSSRIAAALALAEVGHRVFVGISDILLREAVSILSGMTWVKGRMINPAGLFPHIYNPPLHPKLQQDGPIITIFEESRLDFFIEKGLNIFEDFGKPDQHPVLIASTEAGSKIGRSGFLKRMPEYFFSIIKQIPVNMAVDAYVGGMIGSADSVQVELSEANLAAPKTNCYVYSTSGGRKLLYGEEYDDLDLYGYHIMDYVNQIMSEPMARCMRNPDTKIFTKVVNYPTVTQGIWLYSK